MRKIQANDAGEKPSRTDEVRRAQIDAGRTHLMRPIGSAFMAETLVEVDHLDWSLIEVWERIRTSRDAIASSRELLLRTQKQESGPR